MRYIAIYNHWDVLFSTELVFYKSDSSGKSFINATNNVVTYINAKPINGGAYDSEGTIMLPESDLFFNYFTLDRGVPIYRTDASSSLKDLIMRHLLSLS